MIIVEKLERNIDKYCINCNEPKDSVKALKFSVKDNQCSFNTVCLCKDCRLLLADMIREAEQED